MNNALNTTQLLKKISAGDKSAWDKLFPLVYNELHRISENQLHNERKNHTINATALVHDAYIKITGKDEIHIDDRVHFFAIAAKCMREILIDYARKRKAEKRGGAKTMITFDEQKVVREFRDDELLFLNDSLQELEKEVPRVSKVVELKFFAGLSYNEIAQVLAVSVPTVRRDWRFGKAWLGKALTAA